MRGIGASLKALLIRVRGRVNLDTSSNSVLLKYVEVALHKVFVIALYSMSMEILEHSVFTKSELLPNFSTFVTWTKSCLFLAISQILGNIVFPQFYDVAGSNK